MALVVKDRVKETTTTTGTGTLTLAGAVTGFQAFSVIGDGNTTYYTITDSTNFEVGVGTYTLSGTTLSRDTIFESSNSGSAVNWGAGSKDVFVTYPAERSVYTDAAGTAITPATTSVLGVSSGGTGAATLTANNVILGNGTSAVQFVAPSTTGNVLTSDGTTWTSAAAGGGIPSGTVMMFFQAAAPTGFTQIITQNNKALRVVSGAGGGTGGSVAFTTAFASQTPSGTVSVSGSAGSTTLSIPQIPSHSHQAGNSTPRSSGPAPVRSTAATGIATGNAGGGGSHNHPLTISSSTFSGNAINLAVQYIDVIIASKD
jgi:hypothetical protein